MEHYLKRHIGISSQKTMTQALGPIRRRVLLTPVGVIDRKKALKRVFIAELSRHPNRQIRSALPASWYRRHRESSLGIRRQMENSSINATVRSIRRSFFVDIDVIARARTTNSASLVCGPYVILGSSWISTRHRGRTQTSRFVVRARAIT